MWLRANPFSALVLPLRLSAVAVLLYSFVTMLTTPDIAVVAVVLVGLCFWMAGTLAQESSALYRRLKSLAAGKIARKRIVRVRSTLSIAEFLKEYPDLGSDAIVITTEAGYDAGIVMPETIRHGAHGSSGRSTVGELAKPISYVDALRPGDPVLDAFLHFRKWEDEFLLVLDRRDAIAGVVAKPDLNRWVTPDNHRPNATEAYARAA